MNIENNIQSNQVIVNNYTNNYYINSHPQTETPQLQKRGSKFWLSLIAFLNGLFQCFVALLKAVPYFMPLLFSG